MVEGVSSGDERIDILKAITAIPRDDRAVLIKKSLQWQETKISLANRLWLLYSLSPELHDRLILGLKDSDVAELFKKDSVLKDDFENV